MILLAFAQLVEHRVAPSTQGENGSAARKAAHAILLPCSSPFAQVFVVLALLLAFAQCASLVSRARHGKTDFYVIHRAVTALDAGGSIGKASGDFYAQLDSLTRWQRTLPPGALMFFQPFAHLSRFQAGLLWASFNFALAIGSCLALRRIFLDLPRHRNLHRRALPWMMVVFLALSSGSLQVGQVSLLFVSCWIFYLAIVGVQAQSTDQMTSQMSKRHICLAGVLLGLPCVFKIYALVLWCAPAAARRWREVRAAFFAVLIIGLALPFAVYRGRALELNQSFVANVWQGNRSRMQAFQQVKSVNEQGLDSVFQRYLTHSPEARRLRHLPHLHLPHSTARALILATRIVIIVTTLAAVIAWQRRRRRKFSRYKSSHRVLDSSLRDNFFLLWHMAALWSSTLYVLLPGAKSRYAVYAALGFYPLLLTATALRQRTRSGYFRFVPYLAWCALIVFCAFAISQAVPYSWRIVGIGLVGAVALWLANLRHIARLDRC